jgi:hypothetical protein
MKSKHFVPIASAISLLVIASLACAALSKPEPTPTPLPPPTNTPIPLPSPTERPTLAPQPQPSAAPTLAISQPNEEFESLLNKFYEKGYVSTTEGEITELDPFNESSSELGWQSYWPYDFVISDFVFKAHYKWSTAVESNNLAGCGIMFGLQENGNSYGVFLDKSRIYFTMARGSFYYDVGKTNGSGRTNFGNPAEADFAISVKGKSAYVLIDNEDFTEYTLSQDQTTNGNFALTLMSGTTRDYGTRCEMTDLVLWTPK